ncbi:sodium-coupled monocarboxylate transporter 2-like [Amblyomma americanum]
MSTFKDYQNLAETTTEFLWNKRRQSLPKAPMKQTDPYKTTSSDGIVKIFKESMPGANYGFSVDIEELFYSVPHNELLMAAAAGSLLKTVIPTLVLENLAFYIRLRFNSAISLTACIIYMFVTVSFGAIIIFAASLAIVTVFGFPLLWCNIIIGLSGTIYTALGGLRAVVWTDCMQLLFIILGPATVIGKVFVHLNSTGRTSDAFKDFSFRSYILNTQFDLTHDESVWVAVSSMAAAFYRVSMDQVVMQRGLASRTLANAQRTIFTGCLLLLAVYAVEVIMVFSLVLWFRGCDPKLAGAIMSRDQILPFYIKRYLTEFPGFTGLFLSAVVTAATSSISSIINSLAAVLYVDMLELRFKNIGSHARWTTHALAFLFGGIMTGYSCLCVYMGSIVRAIIMVHSAAAGPSLGLVLLAVAFPFVHCKGAGISTLVVFASQIVLLWLRIQNGAKPPSMAFTLDYCPQNSTNFLPTDKVTAPFNKTSMGNTTSFLPSPFWSCSFATCATVILGVVFTLATGEHRNPAADATHLNSSLTVLWRKLGVLQREERNEVRLQGEDERSAEAFLQKEEDTKRKSTV